MKNWIISPSEEISGDVQVARDKSISHRAVMLAALSDGCCEISNFLDGEDCLATLAAFSAMGIQYERAGSDLKIYGKGLRGLTAPSSALDFGNSGTGMRLMMGVLAGQKFNSTLIGDSSLMKRPMRRVSEPLTLMGAQILTTEKGTAPVQITGSNLTAIDFSLPVASAQLKSALMFAALYADGTTTIRESLGISRDHSERMFSAFALDIVEENTADGKIIKVTGGKNPQACDVAVPGDISSAAFFIVAGLIAKSGKIVLREVGINPTRAAVIDILKMMGGRIELKNIRNRAGEDVADIEVLPSELHGIDIPAKFVPIAIDEFPILFIAASCASGVTTAEKIGELRVKESDRLGLMEENLRRLGIECEAGLETMKIVGKAGNDGDFTVFRGGEIETCGDHRIAMSFAVASLRAATEIKIIDCENVATSFPNFLEIAEKTGLKIREITEYRRSISK